MQSYLFKPTRYSDVRDHCICIRPYQKWGGRDCGTDSQLLWAIAICFEARRQEKKGFIELSEKVYIQVHLLLCVCVGCVCVFFCNNFCTGKFSFKELSVLCLAPQGIVQTQVGGMFKSRQFGSPGRETHLKGSQVIRMILVLIVLLVLELPLVGLLLWARNNVKPFKCIV